MDFLHTDPATGDQYWLATPDGGGLSFADAQAAVAQHQAATAGTQSGAGASGSEGYGDYGYVPLNSAGSGGSGDSAQGVGNSWTPSPWSGFGYGGLGASASRVPQPYSGDPNNSPALQMLRARAAADAEAPQKAQSASAGSGGDSGAGDPFSWRTWLLGQGQNGDGPVATNAGLEWQDWLTQEGQAKAAAPHIADGEPVPQPQPQPQPQPTPQPDPVTPPSPPPGATGQPSGPPAPVSERDRQDAQQSQQEWYKAFHNLEAFRRSQAIVADEPFSLGKPVDFNTGATTEVDPDVIYQVKAGPNKESGFRFRQLMPPGGKAQLVVETFGPEGPAVFAQEFPEWASDPEASHYVVNLSDVIDPSASTAEPASASSSVPRTVALPSEPGNLASAMRVVAGADRQGKLRGAEPAAAQGQARTGATAPANFATASDTPASAGAARGDVPMQSAQRAQPTQAGPVGSAQGATPGSAPGSAPFPMLGTDATPTVGSFFTGFKGPTPGMEGAGEGQESQGNPAAQPGTGNGTAPFAGGFSAGTQSSQAFHPSQPSTASPGEVEAQRLFGRPLTPVERSLASRLTPQEVRNRLGSTQPIAQPAGQPSANGEIRAAPHKNFTLFGTRTGQQYGDFVDSLRQAWTLDRAGYAPNTNAIDRYVRPLLDDVAATVGQYTTIPANYLQGALAAGLRRYDAVAADLPSSTNPFSNALTESGFLFDTGDGAQGEIAARDMTGARRIGESVPELGENTVAGTLYNGGVRAGLDPTNLLFAPEKAISMPVAMAETLERARLMGEGAGDLAKAQAIYNTATTGPSLAERAYTGATSAAKVGVSAAKTGMSAAREGFAGARDGWEALRGRSPLRDAEGNLLRYVQTEPSRPFERTDIGTGFGKPGDTSALKRVGPIVQAGPFIAPTKFVPDAGEAASPAILQARLEIARARARQAAQLSGVDQTRGRLIGSGIVTNALVKPQLESNRFSFLLPEHALQAMANYKVYYDATELPNEKVYEKLNKAKTPRAFYEAAANLIGTSLKGMKTKIIRESELPKKSENPFESNLNQRLSSLPSSLKDGVNSAFKYDIVRKQRYIVVPDDLMEGKATYAKLILAIHELTHVKFFNESVNSWQSTDPAIKRLVAAAIAARARAGEYPYDMEIESKAISAEARASKAIEVEVNKHHEYLLGRLEYYSKNEISTQLRALRTLKEKGIDIPEKDMDDAISYLKRYKDNIEYAKSYQISVRQGKEPYLPEFSRIRNGVKSADPAMVYYRNEQIKLKATRKEQEN